MIKARPAGSMQTIDEAMGKLVDIRGRSHLLEYLKQEYDFWEPTDENVKVEFYGRDDRIDWDTYLVTIDGKAALFTDGPVPKEQE